MIKAIETVYNGYKFRSRLEARWAVCFDALGIRYEYEKEGYDLGDAGYYLPDFWLPDMLMYAEVKCDLDNVTDAEANKAFCLASETLCPVIIVGNVEDRALWIDGKQPYHNNWIGYFSAVFGGHDASQALQYARQARFEHGETPRVQAKARLYPAW